MGEGYARPLSIPQGCPLSMLWLGVVMRPLTVLCRLANALPRTLADDLTVSVRGALHWRGLIHIATGVHLYLVDAGAVISSNMSLLFSTSPLVRSKMRRHVWRHLHPKIIVAHRARYLGSHVSFTKCLASGTLANRMHATVPVLMKLARLPMDVRGKARVIRTKAHGKALFGCESAPVQSNALRKLTSATKTALSVGVTPMCSPGLLFATFGLINPDPALEILLRRIKLARVMYHDPVYHGRISALMIVY